MKKIILFWTWGIITLLGINACKSELDLDKTLKFSKISVEDQKAAIEKSGINFIDNMEGIQDTKAYSANMEFINRTDGSKESAPMRVLIQDLSTRNTKVLSNLDQQFRVIYVDTDLWGEWEWNSTLNDFELIEALTNKAIYHFPATETSKTNNAEITIIYTESDVLTPDTEEFYPSSISYVLKVDGAVAMKADFSGTYKNDGTPLKVKQSMEMGKYSWKAEINNNVKEVSESYEFIYDGETLVKVEGSAKGDLSVGTIENVDSPEDVLKTGAVYFQLMNIAVLGGVKDMEAFVVEAEAIEDNENRTTWEKRANVINKHLICYGYFVDNKTKFAEVEFYVTEEEEEQYDYTLDKYVMVTYYDLMPRFVLSDGSKVDIENYIETGFDDLIERIEGLEL